MVIISDERIFKISKEGIFVDRKLKKESILRYVEEILNERKEMPSRMELKFIY